MSIMLPDTPWCIDTPAERATPRTVHRTTCPGPADGKVVPLHNMKDETEDSLRAYVASGKAPLRLCPVCLPEPGTPRPEKTPTRRPGKTLRVYRLDVVYPEGSDDPEWTPPGWEDDEENWSTEVDTGAPYCVPFSWPRVNANYFQSGANHRAELLRKYGAKVKAIRSKPVEWEDSP